MTAHKSLKSAETNCNEIRTEALLHLRVMITMKNLLIAIIILIQTNSIFHKSGLFLNLITLSCILEFSSRKWDEIGAIRFPSFGNTEFSAAVHYYERESYFAAFLHDRPCRRQQREKPLQQPTEVQQTRQKTWPLRTPIWASHQEDSHPRISLPLCTPSMKRVRGSWSLTQR